MRSVLEKLDVRESELLYELLLELGFELLLLEVGFELLRELLFALLLLRDPPPREPPFALISEAETAPKIRLIMTINEINFFIFVSFLSVRFYGHQRI